LIENVEKTLKSLVIAGVRHDRGKIAASRPFAGQPDPV
jgi:hypothetical protein